MISLISMGLFDEKDLTLRGIEEAKNADKVYIEMYTGKWYGDLKKLEELVCKTIYGLKRADLEENSKKIIDEAKTQNIAVFIQGSAVIQTTHLSLIQEAKKLGIKTKIIHNASIISAIGEIGLHPQKFGQYITIPFSERTRGVLPESVFDIINENRGRGLHTLCLLDIDIENNRYMSVNDAIDVLRNGKAISNDSEIVVFAKAGSDLPLILYEKVSDLYKKNINEIPAILILPGNLHYTEKELLNLYSGV